jgi:hypothetical protein
MKRIGEWKLWTMGLVVAGFLTGCGSGGGEATVSTAGSGSGSAAATGTITGFGSVFVNGKRFETDHASFLVDDQPGTQSDLKLGMTVAVTGTLSNNQRSARWFATRMRSKGWCSRLLPMA